MVTIFDVKLKSHQELPFRIALDDHLLCSHGAEIYIYIYSLSSKELCCQIH